MILGLIGIVAGVVVIALNSNVTDTDTEMHE